MSRIQLSSFYLERARASPRAAKARFAAVAPALVVRFGRRSSNVSLDTIAEEDGMAEPMGESDVTVPMMISSSPSRSLSPSSTSAREYRSAGPCSEI